MRRTPRAAAMVVGVLVGLTGLFAAGSPASATAGNYNFDCVKAADARYTHTFNGPKGTASIEVKDGKVLCEEQKFALVSYTAPSARFATPQFVLDTAFGTFEKGQGGKLDFTVEVPQCFTQVDFVFGDQIIDPLTDTSDRYNDRKVGSKGAPGSRSTALPGQPQEAFYNGGSGTCKAEPAVEALPDCEGNVNLKLINRSTSSEKFTITADGGFTKTETLAVSQVPVTVTVPAANAKNIVVTSRGKELYRGEWTKPEDCKVPAAGTVTSTCDGISFTVKNPQDGADVSVTFTPGTGEARTVTAAPGETKSIVFPGTEGLIVTVTGDVPALNGAHKWTAPENCGGGEEPSTPASPSPSVSTPAEPTPSASTPAESPSASVSTTPVAGNDEEEPQLPLTGSAAAGVAGGAFLLLVAGAVLFIVARRRKVNFTA
ncbi:hypothetical protein [Actinoplanes derwentensis]|uniref:LPXTG-motif cell wall anchor domain-containing protein n=1 Tax=Actinoplanes derwentensis TaxID=113562 RepID=A0A1H2D512_9ACTN|nr:hypothetical protein [Actinoplanes derwentensis]GID87964.1 hypothetical protein Ade03nite_68880 [Actinoplanes derwentensis]SDT77572.1 hypothetical protein SAMN04489716_8015 [Actinoplanes derwentensis]